MSIYVEILMRADLEALWRSTQTPDLHAQWDLRFTDIEYLPRPDPCLPQRFLYRTRIGFGLAVEGEGETVGARDEATGRRTSALKFWSHDPRSLIREGSGYWQYVPCEEGVRFLTRYDYRTRFGAVGRWFDALVFRPLMGWATAWSFDRLRLWLERGVDPRLSLERAMLHGIARVTLAVIWLYQGIVPKLLFRDGGELNILRSVGLFHGREASILSLAGLGEILFGLLMLCAWRSRQIFIANVVLLALLALGAIGSPAIFVAPFNPVALSLAMTGLALIGYRTGKDLPTARNCRRRPA